MQCELSKKLISKDPTESVRSRYEVRRCFVSNLTVIGPDKLAMQSSSKLSRRGSKSGRAQLRSQGWRVYESACMVWVCQKGSNRILWWLKR